MFSKAKLTYHTFGLRFFLRYTFMYLGNKFNTDKSVKKVMQKCNIPILDIQGSINSKASLDLMRSLSPDLLISIAFNQIFRRPLIELAPKGCLNLHTALLPKYRGLMPTFWVLKNNEKYTGVSVFFVDEGIDTGPILVQKKTEIGSRSLESLIRHTKQLGMEAILEAIQLIHLGGHQVLKSDGRGENYYTFPTKNDVAEFIKSGKRLY